MKLKEFYNILFKYNLDDLEKIVFLNKVSKTNKVCDYAILFGGTSMIPYRANKAISLYNSGLIKKIVVTGGYGYFKKRKDGKEAVKLYKYLTKNKIPANDILIESKSKSTIQNIKYSYNLLKNKINSNTSVLIITSDFHMKRCLFLFKKYFKNIKVYKEIVKDEKTDKENFKKTKYGKNIIKREALLLCLYGALKE